MDLVLCQAEETGPMMFYHYVKVTQVAAGQNQWYHVWLGFVNSPPILEPILVGIGMHRMLTHGQVIGSRETLPVADVDSPKRKSKHHDPKETHRKTAQSTAEHATPTIDP